MTLDIKEQGQKIITHEEFLAQCRDHPNKLFDYVVNTFNCMIDLKNKYHEQMDKGLIQTLCNKLQEHKA